MIKVSILKETLEQDSLKFRVEWNVKKIKCKLFGHSYKQKMRDSMDLVIHAPMNVTLTGTVVNICPVSKTTDFLTVILKYSPMYGQVIELFDFKKFLQEYNGEEVYIEELADELYNNYRQFKPDIKVTDNTSGVQITVEVPGNGF
jgi:hypothetical protein